MKPFRHVVYQVIIDKRPPSSFLRPMLRCLTVVALLIQISVWGMQLHVSGPECGDVGKVCCCDSSGSEPPPWQPEDSCDGCLSCEDQDGTENWPDLGINHSGAYSSAAEPARNVIAFKTICRARLICSAYATRPPGTDRPSQAVLSCWLI